MTVALLIVSLFAIGIADRALRRLRRAEADRDRFSAQLDHAHLAGAALAATRNDFMWHKRAIAVLRASALAYDERDRMNSELRAVTDDREALGQQAIEVGLQLEGALRREGRQIVRNVKRRAALVRVVRAHRQLRAEFVTLTDRRDALLKLVANISQTTPLPDELLGWEAQRAALIAEVGTLRSANEELRRASVEQFAEAEQAVATACANVAAHAARELEPLRAVTDAVERYVDAGGATEESDVACNLQAAVHGLRAGRPCSVLDASFDGEADVAQVDAFRSHLADCTRCQRVLHGRMQERMVVDRETEIDAFADGELSAATADAFRAHLRGCERCRAELTEHIDLSARLSTLPLGTP